jgi:membrane protein
MLAYFERTLTWRELLRRTVKEILADDGLGLAAQLAYYFFLALFPALLFLLALASYFPLRDFSEQLTTVLGRFAAPELTGLIRDQLAQIANRQHGGLLSLGLVGALWSSSAALTSLIDALNRAYDVTEQRPWWKVRLLAITLTVALAAFVLAAFSVVVAGPAIGSALTEWMGLDAQFLWTWALLQWPLAFVLVCVAIGIVYYLAPDAEQEWVWVTPGSVVATVLWLVASVIFRVYVTSFGSYQETYGALGGVIVLLLWLYLTGLALVIGAEVNAEIEHASPWGKDPGERAPGARKRIGAAAARAFRARPRNVTSEEPVTAPPSASPLPAAAQPTLADWVLASILHVVWPRLRHRRGV